jgi:hypothetical protein
MGQTLCKARLPKALETLIEEMIVQNAIFALDRVNDLLKERKSYDSKSKERIWHLHEMACNKIKKEYQEDEVKNNIEIAERDVKQESGQQ